MQNCEEHCRYTHICRNTYPDNDGGCWCHEDGYCVDGRKKDKNKNGMRVRKKPAVERGKDGGKEHE